MIEKLQNEHVGLNIGISLGQHDDLFIDSVNAWFDEIGATPYIYVSEKNINYSRFLAIEASDLLHSICPNSDTALIASAISLEGGLSSRLAALEIVLSMVASPVGRVFPSIEELQSNIRMRLNIVEIAMRTELNFNVEGIQRPETYWIHTKNNGFILHPQAPLIEGLEMALCPSLSGNRYSFSCQRATEYLMLYGIAKELESVNISLLNKLQSQWETRALVAVNFFHSLLTELGSMSKPFPARCYTPGDRVWFKNPDDRSSDVVGYEGSWVIYLGAGKFTNLWDSATPHTLESKCIEIFHWRDGLTESVNGFMTIDEDRVQCEVLKTFSNTGGKSEILRKMLKYRDPSGIYGDGGCLDPTRDDLRWVHPETTNIQIHSDFI